MQTEAERTLNNLHVLAALSHNDKLLTNDDAFGIYAPTSLRGLFRMWYGEHRVQNVVRVRQTVRAATAFAAKSLDDVQALGKGEGSAHLRLRIDTLVVQHLRMCEALRGAKNGLDNLTQTYRGDAALTSQLQLLCREVDDFLEVMAPHSDALRPPHSSSDGGCRLAPHRTLPPCTPAPPSPRCSRVTSASAHPSDDECE